MSEKKSMLKKKDPLHSLKYFRNSFNSLRSLADFVYDVSTELLIYADELRRAEDNNEDYQREAELSPGEVARLRSLALKREKWCL